MFNNRRLLYSNPRQPESTVPLPFSLYGQIEAQMAEQMRRNQPPMDEYLFYRIAKQNAMELL